MKKPELGNAYAREDAGEVILTDRPSPRPRDAATLILVRRDQSQPRVLMGKRSSRHDFMPDSRARLMAEMAELSDAQLTERGLTRQTLAQQVYTGK